MLPQHCRCGFGTIVLGAVLRDLNARRSAAPKRRGADRRLGQHVLPLLGLLLGLEATEGHAPLGSTVGMPLHPSSGSDEVMDFTVK